jgi:carbon-monoxide dehydrogenase medium subunit
MKPARFDYTRPRDLAEAVKSLGNTTGLAKAIAGGQSLGPMLNLRLARPSLLVDIARLPELKSIDDKGTSWRIGAGVTHAQIEDATLPGGEMLVAVAAGIAYRTVRNRGTIGGSIAHADPAADWLLALVALGAKLHLYAPRGRRVRELDGFMKGAFVVDLADDEVIEAVEVPKLSANARWGYQKFCRKTGEFAEASAAAVFDPASRTARLFVGALSGAPQALPRLAQAAAEKGLAACGRDAVTAGLAEAAPELDAIDRRMHAANLQRTLEQALRP